VNIVDANVLLYAVNEDAPNHDRARRWLDASLSGNATVGFSWIAILAFVRLSTKAGLFPHPMPIADALQQVEEWTSQPSSVLVEPTSRHLGIVAGLLGQFGTGGNLVNDAHLGALSIEHHGAVVSFDNDFGRFAGVTWRLPSTD
jgi:toxin-antitoxin system PIN domain toxin